MAVNLELVAVDRSTYIVRASFTDEDDEPTIPTALTWSLTNSAGNIINGREDEAVTSLAEQVDIVLSGDDLAFADGPTRILTLEATYNSTLGVGLPIKGQCRFDIEDLLTA